PFSKSNDSRIYMFLVLYSDTVWCRLFVHHRWLYKYVLEHARERTTEVTVVPWDKWGPQNTRMLPGADHRWIRHVHGERVVLPCRDPTSVEVLDFGIIPRRAGATTDITPSARFSTVLRLEPSTLEVDGVFRDAVTTSLPYRSALRSLDKEYDLFLIDQDRIIGM
ncbi:hypothetical protein B0H13DRAFT_1459124, partial [Mycena leptocephala]